MTIVSRSFSGFHIAIMINKKITKEDKKELIKGEKRHRISESKPGKEWVAN